MIFNFLKFWDINFFYGLDFSHLGLCSAIFFIICIICVAIFEFINGFHDTANAVATVIYTKTLKPLHAVIYSGSLNFLGVLFGGITVAIGIINLLPLSELMLAPEYEKIALILALLLTAILWNLGTWYLGIPCSSSHTLIGSILGVGIGFKYFNAGTGINWQKATDIGYALLFSPLFGFSMAILLIFLLLRNLKLKSLFKEPKKKDTPPNYIKATLITTCGLVSFFHGSNDGQKGVGLLLVVLITFVPASFILNPQIGNDDYTKSLQKLEWILNKYDKNDSKIRVAKEDISQLKFTKIISSKSLTEKTEIRKKLLSLNKELKKLETNDDLIFQSVDRSTLKEARGNLKHYINFAPLWVLLLISLSLGIGTMVGYRRIVKTIGEKIGKEHLTYGQGATSELIAAMTVGLSTNLGLPVSTTHVLSSAIAGSMVATGGVDNLQKGTVKNIAWAWLLTLPVTILAASLLFVILRAIMS